MTALYKLKWGWGGTPFFDPLCVPSASWPRARETPWHPPNPKIFQYTDYATKAGIATKADNAINPFHRQDNSTDLDHDNQHKLNSTCQFISNISTHWKYTAARPPLRGFLLMTILLEASQIIHKQLEYQRGKVISSMKRTEDKYEVTVRGQYYNNVNGVKGQKNYEFTMILGESARKQGFLSVIRKNYLDDILRNKHEDYKRFRTHEIISVVNVKYRDQPINEIGLMNRKQLVAFIRSKKLGINPALYPTAADLRAALINYKDNKTQFLKVQEHKHKRMAPTLQINKSFVEDNPELAKLIGKDTDYAPNEPTPEEDDGFGESVPNSIDFGPKMQTISNDDEDDFDMSESDLDGL